MQTLKATDGPESSIKFVTDWWRTWKSHRAAMAELNRCGEDETAHIARDIGLSASELQTLAGKWPDSADLLPRRMSALGFDRAQILQTEPHKSSNSFIQSRLR